MSDFAKELSDFRAAVGEAFGEHFTWTPMATGNAVNAPPTADTSRTGGAVIGIYFDKEAKAVIPNNYDPRTDLRPGVMTGLQRVEFHPDPHTGKTPDIRRGDILQRVESGARWRVDAPFVTKTGIKVCPVNALGVAQS